mgnify:CR=1 FL=1
MKNTKKTEIQKIRLILNIIAPDNKDKKMAELRTFLFKGLKTKEECEEEGIEFDEKEHKLVEGSNQIDEDVLE